MALSVKSALKRIPPAVSRHAVLWRPDFPPLVQERLPARQASYHYAIIFIVSVAFAGVASDFCGQQNILVVF